LKKLGVDVEVLYGSCSPKVTRILEEEGIPYKELVDKRGIYRGALDKLSNYISFRKSLSRELKQRELSNTLLWFGNAETLLSMRGTSYLKDGKYAITFLELLDDHPFRMFLLKKLAQKAKFTISCEVTRAYIMKYWWKLDTLPYVMPNKPYEIAPKGDKPTDPDAIAILSKLDNKKIIIYQGLIDDSESLNNIVSAIDKTEGDYVLLLMGMDRDNIFEKIQQKSSKVYCSKYITAPNHLQVTSRAFAGIVFYNGDKVLNNAFCAPNKIYEYGAYGVPMIANTIPGLQNTVGACGAAVCSDLSIDSVTSAIKYIDDHYTEMSKASRDFYESTDISAIMKTIVEEQLNN
jgi:glycosyltransferase involved in cell wall biosynthesis